jgi:hypothetical protein
MHADQSAPIPSSNANGVACGDLVRPFSGEIRHHDKHGEVEVLRTWGPRACKVRVVATGAREILFDDNLHRTNKKLADR